MNRENALKKELVAAGSVGIGESVCLMMRLAGLGTLYLASLKT